MADFPDPPRPTGPSGDLTSSGAGWLIHHLPMGVIIQDHQTRILDANPAALSILGLNLEEVRGHRSRGMRWSLTDEQGQALEDGQQPALRALKDAQVCAAVVGLQPSTGDRRWLKITAIPQRSENGTLRVYSVFEDVTESHAMRLDFQRSEQRYRALVAATSQYVWTNSPEGEMNGDQPDWAALTGQTPDAYRGYGWTEALHPDDREPTIRQWEAALATRSRFETEHRVLTGGGEYRSFSVRAIPLLGQQGELLEWVGLHTDVTPLRTAEAALKAINTDLEAQVRERSHAYSDLARFNSLLLSSAGEGIFGLDSQGRAMFANPAAAALLGYSVEELQGQNMHALIHFRRADGSPYPEADSPVSQTLRHPGAQPRRVEGEVFWCRDGAPMPVEYVVTALPPSEGEESGGAVLIFQDVTAAQTARAALETAIAELERSNRELEQFAYVSSHDLQEPLRTVGSYAELLGRRYRGQLDPRADQYLDFMQDAVTRMRQLINDLLSFSRIGRNEAVPRPVALNEVMDAVRASLAVVLAENGTELSWEALPTIQGNAVQLHQLLSNLISNALKFRREGVPPQVQLRSTQEGGAAHLTVSDNGIGIAPEFQERVFGLFQRLHRREEYEGTGLGLAICRKIVQAHGGEIWLESEVGVGTTVHLRLPISPPPQPPGFRSPP
ncbi:PAS domain-containing sensor histidine kinase [Deinococcus sp.]|uniref:PAS domain-containing sensor histidine kinase n=1 Tax=Deinococcus sp. TaxID=47478 RepID=UPI003C7D178E